MLIASQCFYALAMLVIYRLNCWFAHVYVDNRLILLCAIVVLLSFRFLFLDLLPFVWRIKIIINKLHRGIVSAMFYSGRIAEWAEP